MWVPERLQSRGNSIGIVKGSGLYSRGSIPGRGKIILFSIASRPDLRHTQPPIQWVPSVLSPGVKRQKREINHSSSSSAEAMNGGAIPPLPMRLHDVVLN
jgi:hypothetical protein